MWLRIFDARRLPVAGHVALRMASITQRGNAWRAIIRRRGQVPAHTFDTKAQAAAWVTAEQARILEG